MAGAISRATAGQDIESMGLTEARPTMSGTLRPLSAVESSLASCNERGSEDAWGGVPRDHGGVVAVVRGGLLP